MKCAQAQRDALAHDLMLDDIDRCYDATHHIRHCSDCRQALRDYDEMRRVLRPQTHEGATEPFVPLGPRRAPIRGQFVAVAAVAVLCVLGGLIGGYAMRSPQAAERAQPTFHRSRIDSSQLLPTDGKQDLQVFQQVSDVYEQRAAWIAMSDHDSTVGLLEARRRESTGTDVTRSVYSLRISVIDGDTIIASTDLVMYSGRTAHWSTPLPNGERLAQSVHVAAVEPRLTYWSEIVNDGSRQQVSAAVAATVDPLVSGIHVLGRLRSEHVAYKVVVGIGNAM